jgi:hypothetical protein
MNGQIKISDNLILSEWKLWTSEIISYARCPISNNNQYYIKINYVYDYSILNRIWVICYSLINDLPKIPQDKMYDRLNQVEELKDDVDNFLIRVSNLKLFL